MRARGPRSEAAKAVLAFICQNAPAQTPTLQAKFVQQAAAAGSSTAKWIRARLTALEDGGYIEFGRGGWVPTDRALQLAEERDEPAVVGSVATPRRVSMFGPTYTSPRQVHRPGADDHAALPSVINGQPRVYRSAW